MKAFAILSLLLILSFSSTLQAAPALSVLSIKDKSAQEIAALHKFTGVSACLEYGDEVIVLHNENFKVEEPVLNKVYLTGPLTEPYVALQRGTKSPLLPFEKRIRVLYRKGGVTVFQTLPSVLKRLMDAKENHFEVVPFSKNLRLHIPAKRILASRKTPQPVIPFGLDQSVDIQRMMDDVRTLENFVTRYSRTEQYNASARWCQEQLAELGYDADLVEYEDWGKKDYNVVAKTQDHNEVEWYYVIGAHLDSISPRPREEAPGADDNASGTAGVIEMARLFAGTEMAKHLQFVLFGSEEVGLRGSTAYVKQLKAAGQLEKIRGVVIFDMIGFDRTPPISALVETKNFNEEFIQPFLAAAGEEAELETSVSYYPFGSDHMPFLREKMPCFLFIEDEYGANPNYHQVTDKADDININLFEAIVKVTVRTMTSLLGQP